MASKLVSGANWVSLFDHLGRTSFYLGRSWLRKPVVCRLAACEDAILLAPSAAGKLSHLAWRDDGTVDMEDLDARVAQSTADDDVPELLLLSLQHAQSPEILNEVTVQDIVRRREELQRARKQLISEHYTPRHPALFESDGVTRGLQGPVKRAMRGDLPWHEVVEPLSATGANRCPHPARVICPHPRATPQASGAST